MNGPGCSCRSRQREPASVPVGCSSGAACRIQASAPDFRAAGPAQTPLPELVRVTGRSFQIEEGYEQAKGEVGLDQYAVRAWHAWYRYVTLSLVAYAALAVLQRQARQQEKKAEEPTNGSL